MPKISLKHLLAKLTVLALSATAATSSATAPATMMSTAAELDADLDANLVVDREHLDPHDAALMIGRGLALALSEMRPLSATHLATTWALSPDPMHRAGVAAALEWTFQLLGDGAIIDHLSRDPDPVIRVACARAAWVRRTTGGDAGVLARLLDDPDSEVRAIAARAR